MVDSLYIIAEIGQAHEGSLGIAHSYIDALAETGIDAIKFQVHIADAESSAFEPFRINFSYEDKTRFDYWKRMEFSKEQWQGLKNHCEEKGMDFIPSTFSIAAFELMEEIGVKCYKIASGELSNYLMVERIAETKKQMIISTGMSSFDEIDELISILKKYNNPITLLQCTSAYPTKPEEWGLNLIQEYKMRYKIPVGFSDHSGEIYSCLAATTLGAEVIEFHVVFDKKMFGPDSPASLTIDKVKELVSGIRQIKRSCNSRIDKNIITGHNKLRDIFGKSLAINRDLEEGGILTMDMLESKKPKNKGIDVKEYNKIIAKKLNNDLKKWDFITESDIYD